MNNELKIVKKIGEEIAAATMNMKDFGRREEIAKEIIFNYVGWNFTELGEVPACGANGSVKEMAETYRIQYRCGYGKWNYAPCLEIKKGVFNA